MACAMQVLGRPPAFKFMTSLVTAAVLPISIKQVGTEELLKCLSLTVLKTAKSRHSRPMTEHAGTGVTAFMDV